MTQVTFVMNHVRPRYLWILAIAWTLHAIGYSNSALAQTPDTNALAAISSVTPDAEGMKKAASAAQSLRQFPVERLPALLDAMDQADSVSRNWIRGVVFDVARKSNALPIELFESYAMDPSNNAQGRGLAMELVQGNAPEKAESLIARCLEDPSLPLRQMAVAQTIRLAEAAKKNDDQDLTKKLYRKALASARHPRQLEVVIRALKDLGEQASVAEAFAMIPSWKAIGPFDNVGGIGFDAVYSPEKAYTQASTVESKPAVDAKAGDVTWQDVEANEDSGMVDLAGAFDKEKGAVAYLYTTFDSPVDQPVQARLSCITANKVWINGKELMANEVYHSGTALDQYMADATLKRGQNTILLKICQNEQDDSWAQVWEFQFRLTDPSGKGLKSAN